MELFAAGFNAWNQLSFDSPSSDSPPDDEPRDLSSFTKLLSGSSIGKPTVRLSYTIVRRDGTLLAAGLLPDTCRQPLSLEFLESSVETATGEFLAMNSASSGPELLHYPSFTAWRSGTRPPSLPCGAPAKQLAAFDTGFAVLHHDGTVSTFGDPRFESSLGRDITAEHPATTPAPVPDLNELDDPVTHISAGGLCTAALTQSGSVYVWGTSSAGTHRGRQAFPTVSGMPNYVPVDGDKDVRDVALGDSHAIALTADGGVYVVGDNANGQLGLGASVERVGEWTKVHFEVLDGWEVFGVAAGPKASFIITSRYRNEA